MADYVITLDTGTTNTRVILWNSNREILSSAKREIGVRNTAIDGNNAKLKEAVRDCLEDVLRQIDSTYDDVKMIIASGMITSNVGLVEVPHCTVPIDLKGLAAAVKTITLPNICPIPITFVPGVKNSIGEVNYTNFEAMDIMRGEEVESLAVLEQYPAGKDYLLILPGSHMKFVSVNAAGFITGCLTSISGELLASITNDTIIADAVGRSFVSQEHYNKEMVLLGYDTAKKVGIGRSCFSARILNQFTEKDHQKLANYILGVALQSDVTSVQHSSTIKVGSETDVIVAGKDPLRCAMADILCHEGCFAHVHLFDSPGKTPLSAQGAFLVAQCRNLL